MSLLLAASAACAGRSPAAAAGEPPVNRDRDVITREDLAANPSLRAESVLDVVRSLRPHFLVERGKNSQSDAEAGRVHASIDNGRVLPLEELSRIHANSVVEIRYLNPSAAMQKFGGAAHEGPVILVKTVN